jgi:predicted nucleotidyltransferase
VQFTGEREAAPNGLNLGMDSMRVAMINDEILGVKNIILDTVDCEKIFLFGSYAYGKPTNDSDYDFYIVLKDDSKNPLLVMEDVNWSIAQNRNTKKSIDVLALWKSRFEERSQFLTLERKVANEGILLYDQN